MRLWRPNGDRKRKSTRKDKTDWYVLNLGITKSTNIKIISRGGIAAHQPDLIKDPFLEKASSCGYDKHVRLVVVMGIWQVRQLEVKLKKMQSKWEAAEGNCVCLLHKRPAGAWAV